MRTLTCVLLVSAAATVAGADAGTATGLHGVVMRGPTTPVCRAGEPCDEPAAGVTIAFSANGSEVARTKTTQRGTYRIVLRAGRYAVGTLPRTRIGGRITPEHVRVLAGRMRTVDFSIDTGIR